MAIYTSNIWATIMAYNNSTQTQPNTANSLVGNHQFEKWVEEIQATSRRNRSVFHGTQRQIKDLLDSYKEYLGKKNEPDYQLTEKQRIQLVNALDNPRTRDQTIRNLKPELHEQLALLTAEKKTSLEEKKIELDKLEAEISALKSSIRDQLKKKSNSDDNNNNNNIYPTSLDGKKQLLNDKTSERDEKLKEYEKLHNKSDKLIGDLSDALKTFQDFCSHPNTIATLREKFASEAKHERKRFKTNEPARHKNIRALQATAKAADELNLSTKQKETLDKLIEQLQKSRDMNSYKKALKNTNDEFAQNFPKKAILYTKNRAQKLISSISKIENTQKLLDAVTTLEKSMPSQGPMSPPKTLENANDLKAIANNIDQIINPLLEAITKLEAEDPKNTKEITSKREQLDQELNALKDHLVAHSEKVKTLAQASAEVRDIFKDLDLAYKQNSNILSENAINSGESNLANHYLAQANNANPFKDIGYTDDSDEDELSGLITRDGKCKMATGFKTYNRETNKFEWQALPPLKIHGPDGSTQQPKLSDLKKALAQYKLKHPEHANSAYLETRYDKNEKKTKFKIRFCDPEKNSPKEKMQLRMSLRSCIENVANQRLNPKKDAVSGVSTKDPDSDASTGLSLGSSKP